MLHHLFVVPEMLNQMSGANNVFRGESAFVLVAHRDLMFPLVRIRHGRALFCSPELKLLEVLKIEPDFSKTHNRLIRDTDLRNNLRSTYGD